MSPKQSLFRILFAVLTALLVMGCTAADAAAQDFDKSVPNEFRGDVTLDFGNRKNLKSKDMKDKLKRSGAAYDMRRVGKWDEAMEEMRKLRSDYPDDQGITEKMLSMMSIKLRALKTSPNKEKLHKLYLEMGQLARDYIRGQRTEAKLRKQMSQALINEAIVHSLSEDNEKCLAAIELAASWGFDDIQQLYVIDSFSEIRESKKFRELFGEKADAIEKQIVEQARLTIDRIPAYEFQLKTKTVNGEDFDLTQHRGKLVFINLSSNRDKSRKENLATYMKLAKRYADEQVQFVGIGFEMDRKNSARLSKEYFDKNGINYPFINGEQSILDQTKGLKGFPTLMILDGDGRVRSALMGKIPYATVVAFIDLFESEGFKFPAKEEGALKDDPPEGATDATKSGGE